MTWYDHTKRDAINLLIRCIPPDYRLVGDRLVPHYRGLPVEQIFASLPVETPFVQLSWADGRRYWQGVDAMLDAEGV